MLRYVATGQQASASLGGSSGDVLGQLDPDCRVRDEARLREQNLDLPADDVRAEFEAKWAARE